jgi:hypothetical protein
MRGLLLLLCLLPGLAGASCFPKNDLKILEFASSGISQATFNADLNRLERHYGPMLSDRGINLQINRLWSDGTVNSDTTESGSVWEINSYGGLARYPGMSAAGYTLVACHELGHHMGGAPIYTGQGWPSVEGEADYWSSMKCMKDLGYSPAQIRAAEMVLAKTLARLGGERLPSLSTPDRSKVSRTYEDHPAAQCRLDTYESGLVCNASGNMSKSDPRVGSCYSGAGARPRCWFKP